MEKHGRRADTRRAQSSSEPPVKDCPVARLAKSRDDIRRRGELEVIELPVTAVPYVVECAELPPLACPSAAADSFRSHRGQHFGHSFRSQDRKRRRRSEVQPERVSCQPRNSPQVSYAVPPPGRI